MKTNRIVSFDYLRAIAPFGILLGHFLQGIGANWEIEFYLGTTFNAIFFAMSSILLGEIN